MTKTKFSNGWRVYCVLVLLGIAVWTTRAVSSSRAHSAVQRDVPPAFVVAKVTVQMRHSGLDGSNITITVNQDSVILQGTVRDSWQKSLASQLAQQGARGYHIVNRLQVKPEKRFKTSILNGHAEPTPIPTLIPKSFIEGTVFDARDKTPLSHVQIATECAESDSFGETKSNDNGHFRIAVEAGGDFTLWANGSQHSRRLYEGLRVAPQGLRLDVFLVRRPIVKGIVRDTKGKPLAGTTLYFNSQDPQQPDSQGQAVTDPNGMFRCEDLEVPMSGHGRFDVIAIHPRFSYIQKEFEVRAAYTTSDVVALDLTLPSRAMLTGRITLRGKPLKDAYFIVQTSDGGMPLDENLINTNSAVPSTDAAGRFRFSLSAPQTYSIGIGSDDTEGSTIKLSLRPGQTVNFNRDLKPFPYGAITGRVVNLSGHPVANAAIELWTPRTSETSPVAYTNRNGYYRATEVAPNDDYRVVAYMPQSQMRTGPDRVPVRVRAHHTTIVNLRGDTIPPQLCILSPASGAAAQGIVTVKVRARDNDSLDSVVLRLLDNWLDTVAVLTEDEGNPYKRKPSKFRPVRHRDVLLRWDSRNVPNGRYTLRVDVYDKDGNMVSNKVNVWVYNASRRTGSRAATSRPGY